MLLDEPEASRTRRGHKVGSSTPGMKLPRLRPWLVLLIAIPTLILGAVGLVLRLGGYLLVARDPLPPHAQVAISLSASLSERMAREAEAVRLIKDGLTDYALLSIAQVSYWGEPAPELARHYLDRTYPPWIANRVFLCVQEVHSTIEEALVVRHCLEEHGWRSIIVVTSNFHTRRAGMIWRRVLGGAHPPFSMSVWGVDDGVFEPDGWWRNRLYAKTWLLELTKLIWSSLFDWPGPGLLVRREVLAAGR